MAIFLSGTDSHPSWDGAIRSRRGSNNEKRKWESPIATTFSAFQTSSTSTKAEKVNKNRIYLLVDRFGAECDGKIEKGFNHERKGIVGSFGSEAGQRSGG